MTTSPCVPCCSTPQSVNIPGGPGIGGLNGVNGQNAYTFTIADFTYATGPISVISTAFMVIGQILVVSGPAHVRVSAITGPTTANVVALNYSGDVAALTVIPSGAGVSPSGVVGPAAIAITAGTTVLAAGTVTVGSAAVTANSRIMVTRKTPIGAVGDLSVPSASRVVATSFVINSRDPAAGTIVATDISTVDWVIIG